MVNMTDEFRNRHQAYYDGVRPRQNAGRIAAPGWQYLVHLLRGGYLGDEWRDGRGRRALDAGCGSGFNSVTLALMGWKTHAVEITGEIVEHARASAAPWGQKIEFAVGENENLPYPDGHFDLLVSVNTIHYAPSRQAVERTVREYARVLAPGGRLVASTQHPGNWMLEGCEPLGGGRVKLNRPGDYRDGQVVYRFDDADDLGGFFAPAFADVRVAENRTDFFVKALRHLVLTGVKKGRP